MSRWCALVAAGRKTYAEGLELQQRAWETVAAGEWDGALILLDHFPVVTLGRDPDTAGGLMWSAEEFGARGVEVINCNRGGKTTCHNPGQLVGYPVLDLARWQKDSHWYMRVLEQIIINAVARFGLAADRKAGYTGVWTGDRKIAAIGVAIRRWITSHGFALNVNNDMSLFSSIVPCGIKEFGVTSLVGEGVADAAVSEAARAICAEFQQVLGCSLVPVDICVHGATGRSWTAAAFAR